MGRVHAHRGRKFGGVLDIQFDSSDGLPPVPMGGIGVMPGVESRRLQVLATGLDLLAAGSTLSVVQTEITYQGFLAPEPSTGPDSRLAPVSQTLATYSAADLQGGMIELPVDTRASRFWHLRVNKPQASALTGGMSRVALSNPVAHLQQEMVGTTPGQPQGIPLWKQVVRVP